MPFLFPACDDGEGGGGEPGVVTAPTVSTGSGVPSDADGVNGDIYLRNNGTIYRKVSAAWVAQSTWIANAHVQQSLNASVSITFNTVPGDLTTFEVLTEGGSQTFVFNNGSDPATADTWVDTASGDPSTILTLLISVAAGIASFSDGGSALVITSNVVAAGGSISTTGASNFGGTDVSVAGQDAIIFDELKAAEAGLRHLILAAVISDSGNGWGDAIEICYGDSGSQLPCMGGTPTALQALTAFTTTDALSVTNSKLLVLGVTNTALTVKCSAESGGSSGDIQVTGITLP